jgi:hypothetical protein
MRLRSNPERPTQHGWLRLNGSEGVRSNLIWVAHRVMNGQPLLTEQSGGRQALGAVAPLTPPGESSTLLYGG